MPKLTGIMVMAFVFSSSAICPYSNVKEKKILVADSNCPRDAMACYVSSTCRLIEKLSDLNFTFSSWTGNTFIYRVTAVGDMSNYNKSSLMITSNGNMDMSTMVLPATLERFGVNNASLTTLPTSWSPSLLEISLSKCNLKIFPSNLPAGLLTLDVSNNQIEEISNIPSKLNDLSIESNKVTTIANLNLSQAHRLNFGYNPITTISNIILNESIALFGCALCTPKNITLKKAAFDTINALAPLFVASSANPHPIGFSVSNDSTTSSSDCQAIGGSLDKLWRGKTSVTWQICVLPDIANATSTPSTTKPLTVIPNTSASVNTSENTNLGLILGVSIGGVALIGLIAFFVWKRKKASNTLEQRSNSSNFPALSVELLKSDHTRNTKLSEDAPSYGNIDLSALLKYRLIASDLVVTGERPIASGGFGDVWRGRYGEEEVAIKCIRNTSLPHIQKFADEIRLLSLLQCDYIVQLVGASWSRPVDLVCVVEYMNLGDLRMYLSNNTPQQFTWEQKYHSIKSIIHGLMYLHTFETPIIHRDLKSRNVLLDSEKGTKLTDFGAAREMDLSTLTNGIGTFQWMAPEIISGHEYTVAADVYSLGVLLSEFSTHQVPYSECINPDTKRPFNQAYIMNEVVAGNLKPSFDTTHTPEWVMELAQKCLATNEDERPNIMMIAATLPKII